MLAFSFGFADGTLTLTQTVDDGAVTVDNNGASNEFRTNDGSGLVTYVAATNVVVEMLDGTSNQLDFNLDNGHTGNVELRLGDGTRDVNFDGTSNSTGGDLMVTSGTGNQTVEIGVTSGLTVGGNLSFDLGTGFDEVDEDERDITVANDFSLVGVNRFENGGAMSVGGNLTVDNSNEFANSLFDDDGSMTIAGDFTYTGGDGLDDVLMNGSRGGTVIGGNAHVNVGDNTFGSDQFILFNDQDTAVAGTLTVFSTSASNDIFELSNDATFGGNIRVELGDGFNEAIFQGIFGGTSIDYVGGIDIDEVTFGTTGNPASVDIRLGAGDDNFTLNAGAAISPTLRVDFGGGTDSFDNQFGAFNFNASFLNWDNFNRFYSVNLDQWHMFQRAIRGDISIGNNADGVVTFSNTYATTMSTASTIRLKTFSNTNSVEVGLESPITGDLVLDLYAGDRTIQFVGTSNTVGGNVIIDSAGGDQTVEVSVNSPLTIGGSAAFNLRGGVDVVTEGGNGINVGGSLIFRGVNTFQNLGTVNADRFLMNTSIEVAQGLLDNDGVMNITNSLIYIGGEHKDDIILDDGVTVGGDSSLDVGANMDGFPEQVINLGGGFTGLGSVVVVGRNSSSGNSLLTDATTTLGDNFIINFSENTFNNQAVIAGTFTGDLGFYRGGSGQDVVSMDEIVSEMDFYLKLEGDVDTLNLGADSALNYLYVNFGEDVDIFNDDFEGTYPFSTNFWNLP